MKDNLTHIHLIGDSQENFYILGRRDKNSYHEIYNQISTLCSRNKNITKVLKLLNDISYNIIYGIEGFINGFIKTGNWDLIYSQLGSEVISNILYNNIIWQLDNSILDDIPIFTCEMCRKKDNYINDENICFDCEEK